MNRVDHNPTTGMKIFVLLLVLVGGPGMLVAEDRAQVSSSQGDEWISLFDGESLDEWRASENDATFSVEDGQIVAHGPRAHLFYEWPVADHDFDDFEFRVDVKTTPGSNSGICFHTEYQEEGWPSTGYEVQINNSYDSDPRRTGSLYAVDDVHETLVDDNEWFRVYVRVEGSQIVVKVDGESVVDYTVPDRKSKTSHALTRGTFALQGHDPDSKAYFKNLAVRPLE